MKTILAIFGVVILFTVAVAAQQQPNPCKAEQAKQLDFWIGTWDLEWTDAKGQKQTGTNTVRRILGDCVVEENFSTGGETPYLGRSHSMFDVQSGMWKQTWVDSGGSYLDFTGEFKDGKMTLWREFTSKAGKKIKQRMIFSEITPDSIDWKWEASQDDGTTWKTNWHIKYKRRNNG